MIPEREPGRSGVTVDFDVMVQMRDGVRLATDVYRPRAGNSGGEGASSRPVILARTPYDKRTPVYMDLGQFYAAHDYVFVVQDCRGRFHSEGTFVFLAQEPADGFDTVEWCAAQPWSNGRVGTMGSSYAGWTQWAASALAPPHLETMVVTQGSTHPYHSGVRRNGAMEMRFMAWAFMDAATNTVAMGDPALAADMEAAAGREWLEELPLRPGETPLARNPSVESWALDLYTNGDWTSFWQHPGRGVSNAWDEASDVPTLLISGWYDSHNRGVLEGYLTMQDRRSSPTRLIMGPWTHGRLTAEQTFAGDVECGPGASIAAGIAGNVEALHMRWFDHWLRDIDNGVDAEPGARLFLMGVADGTKSPDGRLYRGGRWIEAVSFPRVEDRSWFLQPGARLGRAEPVDGPASTTWIYDPDDPVPTVGGGISSLNEIVRLEPPQLNDAVPILNRWLSMVEIGGQDQAVEHDGGRLRLADRPDVVSFVSDPLDGDLTVVGLVRAELFVTSDAPDTDVTVKLVDVVPPSADYPEGYDLNLCDSIFRLRYRHGWDAPRPVAPGEVCRIEITVDGTGCVFGQGHRIRLDVSSSNFPQFDPNPNTGEPVGCHTGTRIARNSVRHDATYPSRLILPTLAED